MEEAIQPLGDRILVEPISNEKVSEGGLHIPDVAQKSSMRCRVVTLGLGKLEYSSTIKAGAQTSRTQFDCQVNDVVLISQYCGTEVKLNGKDYKLIMNDDVLGILNP